MPGAEVIARGVRAAMRDRVGHRLEDVAVDRLQRVEVEPSGNAAHESGCPRVRGATAHDPRCCRVEQIEVLERPRPSVRMNSAA